MSHSPQFFEEASRLVRDRLAAGLPPGLHYHGAHHTFLDVLPAVDRLCDGEGIDGPDRVLLRLAALFHDVGFIERYDVNEPIGVRIAAEALRPMGLSETDIDRIAEMILATGMRDAGGIGVQAPGDGLLPRILCDADLDNLGRDDFFAVSDTLRRELAGRGTVYADRDWILRQIAFLEKHRYLTDTARRLRGPRKEENLLRLRAMAMAALPDTVP